MIKAIIFDVSGVLYSDDIKEVFDESAQKLGMDRERLRLLNRKYLQDWLLGEHLDNAMDAVVEREFAVKNFSKTWIALYCSIVKRNDELFALLPRIKERYILAVLSNVSAHRMEADERMSAYEPFDRDRVYLSCTLHMKKPNADFYQYAQKSIGCEPEEIFYVDDAPGNVAAAELLGWHAVVFEDNEQFMSALRAEGIS